MGWDLVNVADTPVFQGGMGLALVGTLAALGRRGLTVGAALARRHLLMSLEVTSKDASYPWVLNWLSSRGRRTQHLTVCTVRDKRNDGSTVTRFEKVPGPGRHIFFDDGRWIWVERERHHGSVALDNGAPWEKVVLTCLGRDTNVFDRLLENARAQALAKDEGRTVIYTSWGTEWRPFGHARSKRPLGSVILDDGIAERIVGDVEEWRQSASWYYERGIPYRRGYLLHGPPGGGKTSFIFALAGYLNYDICILSVSDRDMTDDRLALALSNVPQRCIVLLEDIDAAFVKRSAAHDSRSLVTFSGLLNTLDGVSSSEERLIFMTTNFIERLDPALMRPGRVDFVQLIGSGTKAQARRLFATFYPNLPADSPLPTEFADRLAMAPTPFSMATLQGHLLQFKSSPEDAIRQVDRLAVDAFDHHGRPVDDAQPSPDAETPQQHRPVRRLSAHDVDRLVFNPQPGSGF
ncbi:Mitochondrial chaperone BCS1 [Plasmodiophora brassicae]|uniref:Mitochondrial chaperone BCS1 n=1 Tax=Plasmodiophora brassicae TaxID=37360 RepID=A0A3P3YEP0_PLABS|nr:unnamed protein product [Plasmodiophora brassicae]